MQEAVGWTQAMNLSMGYVIQYLDQENIEGARGELNNIFIEKAGIRNKYLAANQHEIILPLILDAASFEGEL